MKKIINILFVTAILIFHSAWAGLRVNMSVEPSSYLVLKGTSTLHNYECKTTVFKGIVEMDSKGKDFTVIEVSIPVKSIHSESSSLDDNMYEALRADKNPDIKFSFLRPDTLTDFGQTSADSTFKLHGTLTVAGKEKTIDLKVSVGKEQVGEILVSGAQKLLMTDFDIDPPTFMLGLLKTGNEVIVEFNINLKNLKIHKDDVTTN